MSLSNYLTLTNALSGWIMTLSRVTKWNGLKKSTYKYATPILEGLEAK